MQFIALVYWAYTEIPGKTQAFMLRDETEVYFNFSLCTINMHVCVSAEEKPLPTMRNDFSSEFCTL